MTEVAQSNFNPLEIMSLNQAFRLAKKKEHEKDFNAANLVIKSILKKFPKNQRAHEFLCRLQVISCEVKKDSLEPQENLLRPLIYLFNKGHFNEVLDTTQLMLSDHPNSTVLHTILAKAYTRLNKLDLSIKSYEEIIRIDPNNVGAYFNLANNLCAMHKKDAAIKYYKKVTELEPNFVDAIVNLAAVYADQGRSDLALELYIKVITLTPDYGEIYSNIGNIFLARGLNDEAIQNFELAVKIKPEFYHGFYNMGLAFSSKREFMAAIENFNEALRISPEFPEAHFCMGNIYKEIGDLGEALRFYKQALKFEPNYSEAYFNMGIVLESIGEMGSALNAYSHSLKLNQSAPDVLYNMGNIYSVMGENEQAIEYYNRALIIDPNRTDILYNLAGVLSESGCINQAILNYIKLLKINPGFADAHRALSALKKYQMRDEQFYEMEKLYLSQSVEAEDLCKVCFGLAKAEEDFLNIEKSFFYLKQGNSLRKRILNHSHHIDDRVFEKINTFNIKEFNDSIYYKNDKNMVTPVFIVGMPRSGTSLVEQIISSHPEVTAAGELEYIHKFGASICFGEIDKNLENLTNCKNKYLDELDKIRNGKNFVTDKMPQNFLYLGLILAAFPEAKIIHVKRDPRATCWSNYKHYFVKKGLGYSYSLENTVKYYINYSKIMRFWGHKNPDRIYELNYELLTSNQERETKNVIQYLGLDWNNSCLSPEKNKVIMRTASQQQVKNKVYQRSSEAWEKFDLFIGSSFDSLEGY